VTDQQVNDPRPIVFLGGLFLPERIDEIQRQSRGPVQFAADALQKAFLRGFATVSDAPLSVINLPFVGSYPASYRALFFPAWSGTYTAGVMVEGRPFLNLQIVKYLSRFRSALTGLKAAIPRGERATVVIYSAHLPFLAAARLLRWSSPSISLCLILPDLPEFMSVGGPVYVFMKSIESFLFRKLIADIDCFVLLTDAMGDSLGIPPARRIVVEGILDPVEDEEAAEAPCERRADEFPILYTGTLAARYAISDLLDAFERLKRREARLWICGDGDTRPRVEALAARDARVTYFGQLRRSQVLALQQQAAVLVNPRRAEGEFTKYSFPSKTMEYLASGKPVVMHALPGVPKEYHDFLVIPRTQDAAGLAEVLDDLAGRPAADLLELGRRGQSFIWNAKNPETQVGKVIARLRTLENEPWERSTPPSEGRS
jgi:glycosyltransferase involved in cell wall biosynthesis